MKYTAYTDGSANWKNKLGGCGVYIKSEEGEWSISEGYSNTTVSRMEIMALLRTLEYVDNNCELIVYSDSEYVVKSFTENRLNRWKSKDFVGVKNDDLWRDVIHKLSSKNIKFTIHHILGHQKIVDEHTEGNNIADALADYKQFDNRIKDN